jgi:hypothetical protein
MRVNSTISYQDLLILRNCDCNVLMSIALIVKGSSSKHAFLTFNFNIVS